MWRTSLLTISKPLCSSYDNMCRVAAFDLQTCPAPLTSDEFIRVWKRQCPTCESKLGLLITCGPDHLCRLFKVNLPAEILSGILVTLCSMQNPDSDPIRRESQADVVVSTCVVKEGQSIERNDDQSAAAVGSMQTKAAQGYSYADFIFNLLQGLSGEHLH